MRPAAMRKSREGRYRIFEIISQVDPGEEVTDPIESDVLGQEMYSNDPEEGVEQEDQRGKILKGHGRILRKDWCGS
jgi:hypothetical protein